MKSKAILMTLAMMSAALAGCTGSDGVTEIDDETLQQLFDDNIQDFMNNTSVTVNQEIHYHNNTTVNNYEESNEYSNTTNVEGGEVVNNYEENDYSETSYNLGGGVSFGNGVNGSVSSSNMMFVTHLEFTANDLFPDWYTPGSRSNTFEYYSVFYDYLTNSYTNGTFTYSCGEYYLIGSLSNGSTFQVSYWEDNDNYWNAWDNEYNSTTADLLMVAGSQTWVRQVCDESYGPEGHIWGSGSVEELNILSIDIPVGYAIQYIQLNSEHRWSGHYNNCEPGHRTQNCEAYGIPGWNGSTSNDSGNVWHTYPIRYNHSEGPDPGNSYQYYYGGWDNITVDINFMTWYEDQYYSNWMAGNYDYNTYSRNQYVIWPSSQFTFTLYYQFIPVIPTE